MRTQRASRNFGGPIEMMWDRPRRADAMPSIPFDDACVGMCLVGLGFRFIRVNQAFCRMLGYSEPELLATDSRSITCAEDLETFAERGRHLLAGKSESFRFEKRYVHKD